MVRTNLWPEGGVWWSVHTAQRKGLKCWLNRAWGRASIHNLTLSSRLHKLGLFLIDHIDNSTLIFEDSYFKFKLNTSFTYLFNHFRSITLTWMLKCSYFLYVHNIVLCFYACPCSFKVSLPSAWQLRFNSQRQARPTRYETFYHTSV